jgi:multidrug efflux system membrane fusion protein
MPNSPTFRRLTAGRLSSAPPLLALLAGLALAGCQKVHADPSPQPPSVEVTQVVFRPLRDWSDLTGSLEAVESVEIRPRVGGFIDEIRFDDGARVHRGQLLFQIDPRPFQVEVDRAAAELTRARAKAVAAKADGERGKRLIDQNAIARGDFERVDADAKSADADVGAAEAALAAAQLNLSFTHVTSPIDGRISKALITRGNLITPTNVLTTVMSESPIYASFNVDEQTYLKFADAQRGRGGPVYVGLATETGFPHRGRLRFLDNAVDAGSGTIVGRAILDNADGALTPGLFSRIRLLSEQATTVALVPEQALGTDLGNRFVMVVDRTNHAAVRAVTLGPALGELRVVRSGLAPGDTVVVDGLQKIKSGDLVRPVHAAKVALPADMAQLEAVG